MANIKTSTRKRNRSNTGKTVKREQPKKDSSSKRLNYDNVRKSKFQSDVEHALQSLPGGSNPNDISWYSRNTELLLSAGSLPFASVLGAPVILDFHRNSQDDFVPEVIPSIMSILWKPSLGHLVDDGITTPSYAINQAAKAIYSNVVHANSRNYTYEYQDLMILILGGAQVFAAIASAARAYGLAKTYQENNLSMPDDLLTALGFIPSNIRANLAQIWFDINELIAKTQQIWIPNVMPVLKRWFWMNTTVFKDAQSSLSQVYTFVQSAFWQYNETITETGGGLVPVTYSGRMFMPGAEAYNWSTWKAVIDQMINALINSEDRGIIMGDLLNCYGKDNLYAMAPIPVDFRIEPEYSPEVLSQIENLTICPTSAWCGVVQTEEGLYEVTEQFVENSTSSAVLGSALAQPTRSVLNFHFPTQPTPADIMIATRLKTHGPSLRWVAYALMWKGGKWIVTTSANQQSIVPASSGTEIPINIRIYTHNDGSSTQKSYIPVMYDDAETVVPGSDPATAVELLSKYNAFDWHPFIYKYREPTLNDVPGTNAAYGDYDNYSVIDSQELSKLHMTAIYSLFGIPIV